jgi:hypothetical protein
VCTVKEFTLLGTEVGLLQVRFSAALPVMHSQVMIIETGFRLNFSASPFSIFIRDRFSAWFVVKVACGGIGGIQRC